MIAPGSPWGPVPGEVVGSLTVTAVVDVPASRYALDAGQRTGPPPSDSMGRGSHDR